MTTEIDIYTYIINPFMFVLVVVGIVAELLLRQVYWALFITVMSLFYWWTAFEDRRTWDQEEVEA